MRRVVIEMSEDEAADALAALRRAAQWSEGEPEVPRLVAVAERLLRAGEGGASDGVSSRSRTCRRLRRRGCSATTSATSCAVYSSRSSSTVGTTTTRANAPRTDEEMLGHYGEGATPQEMAEAWRKELEDDE